MKSRRVIRSLFLIVIVACLTIVALSVVLNKIVQKEIEKQFSSLPYSVKVKYSSFKMNLVSSAVSLSGVQITYTPYRSLPQEKHVISFVNASITGINFLKILFSKELAAGEMVLDQGNIKLDQFLLDKRDSAQGKEWTEVKWPFRKVSMGLIEIKRTNFSSRLDGHSVMEAKGDLTLSKVRFSSADKMFHFEQMDCHLSGIDYAFASRDSIQIQKLAINSKERNFSIDSLVYHSANKVSIPCITAKGVNVSQILRDHVVTVEKITVSQLLLDVERKEELLLPPTLPFGIRKIRIRALQFLKASVSYKDQLDESRFMGTFSLNGVEANSLNKDGFRFESVSCSLSNLYFKRDHELDVKSFEFDSKKGTMEIEGLKDRSSNGTFVQTISASGIEMARLLKDHLLAIKTVEIDKAAVPVSGNGPFGDANVLPFSFNRILVNDVRFTDGSITYKDKENKCRFKANIHMAGLDVNLHNKGGPHFKSVECNFSDVQYSGNAYHDIVIKSIDLDSKKDIIQVNDLHIVPQFGKYEFDKKLGRQADRVEATIPKVEIIKPQFEELFQRKLFAESIKISGSKAYIFRDRRLPRQQEVIPLPMDYLQSIPVEIRVKSCELASSEVEYEEYPKSGYGQTGIFRLERVRATISPLINYPSKKDIDYLVMKVSASVMGSGSATATMMMPVRKDEPYRIKGKFENLDLPKLNSSSENLGKIRIKSGFLDFLSFDFTMTDQQSTGQIVGAYHGLVIQQLKKHMKTKNVADFSSFMLRHLIIPLNKDESMPEKKRIGKVIYRRDPTRFVTYYYLHTLLRAVEASFTLGFLLPK